MTTVVNFLSVMLSHMGRSAGIPSPGGVGQFCHPQVLMYQNSKPTVQELHQLLSLLITTQTLRVSC